MHSHAGLLMLQPVQLLMVTLLVQAMVLAHVGQARMLELVLGSAHLVKLSAMRLAQIPHQSQISPPLCQGIG